MPSDFSDKAITYLNQFCMHMVDEYPVNLSIQKTKLNKLTMLNQHNDIQMAASASRIAHDTISNLKLECISMVRYDTQ